MPLLPSRIHLLALGALLLLTTGLYFQGLSGPLFFDDGPAITGNGYLEFDGREFDDWRTASLSSNSGPTHRPLAMGSIALNIVAAGGVDAFALKLTNLLIHLACGLLLYLFARGVLYRGFRRADSDVREWAALLAAGLWLLAPLHVSTVLYAVQRMAQLSALFDLAGLALFVYQRERWCRLGAGPGEIIATGLWLLLCTLLATFSKENGFLLLWLLPVVEVSLYRGRWACRDNAWLQGLGWAALLAPLALFAALMLLVPNSLVGGYAGRDFTLEERLLTQLRLLWQYIGWLLWPNINSMGFQHDAIALSAGWLQPVSTLLSGVAWIALLVASFLLRRRVPLLLFATLFYLVGHFMESGVWPLEMVYEHRSYLPSAGIFILLAAGLARLLWRLPLLRPRVSVSVIIAICSTLLFLRVFTWSDGLRLSAVNVANHPDSSRSHFFLAESWLNAYRAGQESGAGRQELSEYLLLARNEFELMYQRNPRDMAALVMLYYMDQHHFPELQQYTDWFSALQGLAMDRPLQASDFSALEALLSCFAAAACTEPEERMQALLDTLNERYPDNTRLQALRYEYLKTRGATLEQRLALLQAMRKARPHDSEPYQYLLLELSNSGDIAGLYETTRLWMAHDPRRRQLSQIRRMFALPERAQASELKPDNTVPTGVAPLGGRSS